MELIAGSSLQDYLSLLKETNRKMIEENIWKVFIQLILALRYLHKEKGIVHRDLTANNIMLDDEYRVKISKFEIFCANFLLRLELKFEFLIGKTTRSFPVDCTIDTFGCETLLID
jgi:serine/threonine protein kinase